MTNSEIKKINHKEAMILSLVVTNRNVSDQCISILSTCMEFPKEFFTQEELFKISFPKNGIGIERREEIIQILLAKQYIHFKIRKGNKYYFLAEKYENVAIRKMLPLN